MATLNSIDQIIAFAAQTKCHECRAEAKQMIEHLSGSGINILRLVFDDACEHGNTVRIGE